ncbi:MAG: serine/threonine-protein kinase, partial [candidate division WOR-3 bacterium]
TLSPTIIAQDTYLDKGKLRILSIIGSGGMGKVFLAEHTMLKRNVAIKELAPHLLSNPDLVERFRREGQALARLSHPNIVQVYDFFEENGKSYLVMEYVDGISLDKIIKNGEINSIEKFKDFALQICRGLEYAHSKSIIHRDLKPHNILVSKDNVVKIADFGLARLLDTTVYTLPGTVIGSPLYMSPEQAEGKEADFRSDIYSFGIILYEMATGRCPFAGNSSEVIAQHLTKKPESPRRFNSKIPPQLEKIILKSIEKKPEDRFASMSEVLKELSQI